MCWGKKPHCTFQKKGYSSSFLRCLMFLKSLSVWVSLMPAWAAINRENKQKKSMINNKEQAVVRDESRSWLCMLCPHGWGRHHITSSGHERTCLLRIVQKVLTSSRRYSALQGCLSESQWPAPPVNVSAYRGWDHASASRHAISVAAWVWECSAETLSNLQRPQTVASMQAKSRIRPRDTANRKGRPDADGIAERSPCCCDRYRK